MNRQLIELGSLAHLSYFWFTLDGVPWQVKRHAEDYTFVEAFGGQEFPTQEVNIVELFWRVVAIPVTLIVYPFYRLWWEVTHD
jgi:hypothetical protein